MDGHSSGTPVTKRLAQPTRTAVRKPTCRGEPCLPSLFGFAPGGVYHAAPVARGAVRSYRTLSPLPTGLERRIGGLLSVALSLGSPPPGVTRHRVSVEPGLSSPQALSGIWRAAIQPSDILKVKPLDRGVKSCRKLQPSTKARPVGGQPRATGADRADRQDIAFEKPPTPPRNPMCHNRIRAT
jgi:hypothetical protein